MIIESAIISVLVFIIMGLAYQFLPNSFGIIAIALIIFYIIYLGIVIFIYVTSKKEDKVVEKEIVQVKKVKDELTELKDYIKYNLYYGQSRQTIERKLLEHGWTPEKIRKGFAAYDKENKIIS